MRKSTRYLKRFAALIFVVLININNFAAVVSDNDGSAFITKAEFEALKINFDKQIDDYNSSIDNKIDGSIAAYLAGIKTNKKETVNTGFDIVGKDKVVTFYGKTNIYPYSKNEPYVKSNAFCLICSAYTNSDFWYEDMQHVVAARGVFETGNLSNNVFDLDNDYIKGVFNRNQVNMVVQGSGYGASSTVFHYGGLWAKLSLTINRLTEAQLNGNYSKTTWPFGFTTSGYGFENFSTHRSSSPAGWSHHSDTIGFLADTGPSCVWWSDAVDTTSLTNCGAATITCNWSYEKEEKMNAHWPWGASQTMKIKPVVYDSSGDITKDSNYIWSANKTYTTSVIVNSRTGSAFGGNADNADNSIWPFTCDTIRGYAPYLNTASQNINNYKYYDLYNVIGRNEKVSDGFFVVSNEQGKEGELNITLNSNTDDTYVFFSSGNFGSSIDSTNYLELEVEDETTGTITKGTEAHLVSRNKNYKIKASFYANDKQIYIGVAGPSKNIDNFEINLTQVGDAILEV